MDQGSLRSGDRFQVRLWDLIVLVVGASYVLDVARRSRLAWGGGLPDLAHAIGLTVLTFGVCVGLVVLGQWVRRLRERNVWAWAVLWRVVAVCWLAGSLVEVAAALQAENTAPVPAFFGSTVSMRLRLAALMTTLGMVGLMLAAAPLGPPSMTPKPRPRWGSWPSVMGAVLVGLVILALGHGLLPYLVMLAIEAVQNALTRAPLVRRPILFDRLMTASLEALPGLLGCLATAIWGDDDLRAAARDPLGARAPRSWRGVMGRAATVALAVSGSAYVFLVSIPKLSPSLAEGLSVTVDPPIIATVALGFATFAAGLAARSAAHLAAAAEAIDLPAGSEPSRRDIGPWPRRVIAGMIGLVSLEITGAALQAIYRDLEYRWYIPIGLYSWGSIIQTPFRWIGPSVGGNGWYALLERPDDILIGIAAIWLTIWLAGFMMSKESDRPSPMDALATDRVALGRFLGWWVGLSAAMLASFPGMAIVGLTIIHFVVRWVPR